MILIGFMGSGKSTIAKRLHNNGFSYIDMDHWIESNEQQSIPEIFNAHGEKHLRALEYNALKETHDSYDCIATGGGIVTYQPSYEFLKSTKTPIVWLDAPIDKLLDRISGDTNRPLAQNKQDIRERYKSRYDLYKSLAHIRIDTSAPVDDCVKEILEFIKQDA